jgi:hypothetical protein
MNIWQELIPVVSKFAPFVATALGGPAAGTMVAMMTSLLGLNKDASVSDIINHINNNPDAAIQLQKLNQGIEWAKIDAQNYQTEVDDRKNAREQNKGSKIPATLAITFTAVYIFVNIMCLFFSSPSHDIISVRIQDIVMTIIGYYFVSTHKQQQNPRSGESYGN